MKRETATVLARVAVAVRAPGVWMWWTGLVAAALGALVPVSLVGTRIGLLAGAALLPLAAVAAFVLRRGRYRELAGGAVRAGRRDLLQDRAVTVRAWRRRRRWWLLAGAVAALVSSLLAPAAGGLLLAGAGAGLWAKAVWLGSLERRNETLLWFRADRAGRGPVGTAVDGYRTTGIAAGDAGPGGGRRKAVPAAPAPVAPTPPPRPKGAAGPSRRRPGRPGAGVVGGRKPAQGGAGKTRETGSSGRAGAVEAAGT
ncbi:hypothetical protein [Streptomyces zingiberis]|uniref:hypothetical protein n=1 Tax=Streptomyces zingiberis TaxID=2053010 RepID=UPI002893058A|nr:hypothetical protein [Streptomyces zingiberis]